jgi:hypothetical protein
MLRRLGIAGGSAYDELPQPRECSLGVVVIAVVDAQ